MATRTAPTERQKRVGAEIRKLRTAAGQSIEFGAGLLGVDRSNMSSMESGVRAISPERLRTLACNYACSDEAYVDALARMAGHRKRGWWERYRGQLPAGFMDIAEMEWHASRMRSANFVHMPGLLQTGDQALAIFRTAVPALPEHEVALRVAYRLERANILTRETSPEYVSIIHEAVLRMQFGERKVVHAQLEHLLTMSERDNIALRVIPFKAGPFPGAGQTVFHLEGPVPALDTVQVDNAHGPEFLHTDAQLNRYRGQLDWMERIALGREESRDFIRAIANEL
ncbi:helix-turn-helix domain-containing protein [Streptomyces sp. KLOTTS4A1]|uniref:helix-turn-helix domain-containing protein n=1 Tax=Streptomyces sp. KLOTTS4A1 TaxID=3390996 RepID=UPI0039F533FF